MTAEHVERFVCALLRELFNNDDSHYYDAVQIAFVESGIHPLATLACAHVHFDTWIERVNHLADQLRSRLEGDEHLRSAVSAAVTMVLDELTIIAPEVHPTSGALLQLIQCCTPGTTTHISDYDAYAALAAHTASCAACERRVRSVAV
jgi:hypothetical protein